jgi:TolA-binding protein
MVGERARAQGGLSVQRVLTLAALAVAGLAVGCGPVAQREDRAAFDDAFAAFRAGHWQRACDGFTRYLRSSPAAPARAEVYYYRGQALVHLGRRLEAQADFQRAIGAGARQPILDFCRVAIGNLYYEEGNDAKAIEWYAQAVREPVAQLPMESLALRLAVSLQRLGRWQSADKYLGFVIDNFPATAAAAEARRRIHADSFTVQTGAYATAAAAQQEVSRLRAAGFQPRTVPTGQGGRTLQAVQVGRVRTYAEAQALAQRLTSAGFATLVVP